jgi:chemotaxis regulatin CheY-phosphate phosphatase CheZ
MARRVLEGPTEKDMQRRIAGATREFHELLRKWGVGYVIERGENSATGKFERIIFAIQMPTPGPDRPAA